MEIQIFSRQLSVCLSVCLPACLSASVFVTLVCLHFVIYYNVHVLTYYLYVILFLSTGESHSSDDELRFSHVSFVENEVRIHSRIYNREKFLCCCCCFGVT